MADFQYGDDPRGHPATATPPTTTPATADATQVGSTLASGPPAAPPTLPATTAEYRKQHFSIVYPNPAIAAAGDRLMRLSLRSPDEFDRKAMLAGVDWPTVTGYLAERCRGAYPDQADPEGVAAAAVSRFREELDGVALALNMGFWDRLNDHLDELAAGRVPHSCRDRSRGRADRLRSPVGS